MRSLILVLPLVVGLAAPAFAQAPAPSAAQSAQRDRMKSCNVDAGSQQLAGGARKGCIVVAVLCQPLSSAPSIPASPEQPPDPMSASPKTDSDPADWRSGYLALRPGAVPCPGFTIEKWRQLHEKGLAFLDTQAEEAAVLGWTTLQLFGVHPIVGIIRPDFCGAPVVSGSKITSLTAQRMGFGNTAFHRDAPDRPAGAVPIRTF